VLLISKCSLTVGFSANIASEGGTGLGFREGRSFRVTLGPGIGSCASFDATRRERAYERVEAAVRRDVNLAAAGLVVEAPASSVIVEWSRKSRARMVKGFASVDWSGLARCYCGEAMTALCHSLVALDRCELVQAMPLAMVTLTYPNDWLEVAPDGVTAKRHLAMFRQTLVPCARVAAGWGLEAGISAAALVRWLAGSTRLRTSTCCVPCRLASMGSISRRGCRQPGPMWSAAVGEERVNHEAAGTNVDFGRTAKMSDPKRCAIYFLKHGSKSLDDKEYQHIVPTAWREPGAGPGRFWGFLGHESRNGRCRARHGRLDHSSAGSAAGGGCTSSGY